MAHAHLPSYRHLDTAGVGRAAMRSAVKEGTIRYRMLGSSDLKVSEISIGSWNFREVGV